MKRAVALAAVLLAVALVAWFSARARPTTPPRALLPYQGLADELPGEERQRFSKVQAQLRLNEQQRGGKGAWPSAFLDGPDVAWSLMAHGPYFMYLGVPADPVRLRWLVLVIEPEPSAIKDPVPPEDEEHHTLSNGTGLHVGVWTAPNSGPLPQGVLPFPAAEGWTQRLGSGLKSTE